MALTAQIILRMKVIHLAKSLRKQQNMRNVQVLLRIIPEQYLPHQTFPDRLSKTYCTCWPSCAPYRMLLRAPLSFRFRGKHSNRPVLEHAGLTRHLRAMLQRRPSQRGLKSCCPLEGVSWAWKFLILGALPRLLIPSDDRKPVSLLCSACVKM